MSLVYPRRSFTVLCTAVTLALTSGCVNGGSSQEASEPPVPGDAENATELVQAVTAALQDSGSADWQLDSLDGGDMAAVDTGRLSCESDGSGTYRIDGDSGLLTRDTGFVPGREHEETQPAELQATGSIATDEGLHSSDGADFWPIDSNDVPTDYRIDLAIARNVNCSHITASLAAGTDWKLDGTAQIGDTATSHWTAGATIADLRDHAKGYAKQNYDRLADLGIADATVDIGLWVDDENRPVVYYQHLPPDRSGLQDRWFALTLTGWNDGDPVTVPEA